jgi:hypothetical protein
LNNKRKTNYVIKFLLAVTYSKLAVSAQLMGEEENHSENLLECTGVKRHYEEGIKITSGV